MPRDHPLAADVYRRKVVMNLPHEIGFTNDDIINPEEWIGLGSNPHNVRPWLLHDHGFVLCVVFASGEQDAIDEAVNQGKLDRYQVTEEELKEYGPEEEGITRLGNAGEPFDIESLGIVELKNPPLSLVDCWAAAGLGKIVG